MRIVGNKPKAIYWSDMIETPSLSTLHIGYNSAIIERHFGPQGRHIWRRGAAASLLIVSNLYTKARKKP